MLRGALRRAPLRMAHVLVVSASGTVIHYAMGLYPAPLSLILVVSSALLCLFSTSAPYLAVLASAIFPLSGVSLKAAVVALALSLLAFALLRNWGLVVVLLALISLTTLGGQLDIVSMALLLAACSLTSASRAVALTILYSLALMSLSAFTNPGSSGYRVVAMHLVPPASSKLTLNASGPAPLQVLESVPEVEAISAITAALASNFILVMNQALFVTIAGYVASKSASSSRHMWSGLASGALSSTLVSVGNAVVTYMTLGYYLDVEYYASFVVLTALLTYAVERAAFLVEKYSDIATPASAEVDVSFSEIGGLREVKDYLRDSIIMPLFKRDVARRYSIDVPRGVLLFGPPGCGKSMLLMALHTSVRDSSVYVRCGEYFTGDAQGKLSRLFSTARRYAPFIILLDDVERVAKGELAEALSREMSRLDGVVVIAATDVPHEIDPELLRPGRFEKLIYVPPPDKDDRVEIFRIHTRNVPLDPDVDIEKLAAMTERFSGADIVAVCREAALLAARESLLRKRHVPVRMGDFVSIIERVKPSVTLDMLREYERFRERYKHLIVPVPRARPKAVAWEAVVDLEDVKRALMEYVELPLSYPELLEKYGVERAPRGVLLFGPPGCGKTLVARTLGSQIEAEFVEVRASEVLESEDPLSALRRALERAVERAPSLLFIDDVHLIGRDSSEVEELKRELADFMDELSRSGYRVVVLGATSDPLSLSEELLRPGRFERFIYVPPPRAEARRELFARCLSGAQLGDDVDFDRLAELTEGYSSQDIVMICDEARARLAELEREGRAAVLTMSDLEEVVRSHRPLASREDVIKCVEFMIRVRSRRFG